MSSVFSKIVNLFLLIAKSFILKEMTQRHENLSKKQRWLQIFL
jgi:hypothetical protein